jgi:hypothetical protein
MLVVVLVDIGQRGLEWNTAVYIKEKAFDITISIIHDISFCGPSTEFSCSSFTPLRMQYG